jgi:thiamine biosynthesis protein ThiS
MITITLQGHPRPIPPEIKTIADLIAHLKIPPNSILVEHNQIALHRHQWHTTPINENDTIELIRIVAGG